MLATITKILLNLGRGRGGGGEGGSMTPIALAISSEVLFSQIFQKSIYLIKIDISDKNEMDKAVMPISMISDFLNQ